MTGRRGSRSALGSTPLARRNAAYCSFVTSLAETATVRSIFTRCWPSPDLAHLVGRPPIVNAIGPGTITIVWHWVVTYHRRRSSIPASTSSRSTSSTPGPCDHRRGSPIPVRSGRRDRGLRGSCGTARA